MSYDMAPNKLVFINIYGGIQWQHLQLQCNLLQRFHLRRICLVNSEVLAAAAESIIIISVKRLTTAV